MNQQQQVRLVATTRQMYEGRALRVGDEYEVPEGEAADLVAMGFATRAPAPASEQDEPKKRHTYKRRDLESE